MNEIKRLTTKHPEIAFGRTLGEFQCVRSKGNILNREQLRKAYVDRFLEIDEVKFFHFSDAYEQSFWKMRRALFGDAI